MKLIVSGGMRALPTLFVLAAAAGLSLAAACTSGNTADCSPDAGGTPNQNPNAWCGVPAGDATEPEGSTMETGTTDSTTEAGPEAAPETGGPETGSAETGPETGPAEGGADAPKG